MDCGSQQAPLSVGILQARILEWVAMPSSRGSSRPGGQTRVSHVAGRLFVFWGARAAPALLYPVFECPPPSRLALSLLLFCSSCLPWQSQPLLWLQSLSQIESSDPVFPKTADTSTHLCAHCVRLNAPKASWTITSIMSQDLLSPKSFPPLFLSQKIAQDER